MGATASYGVGRVDLQWERSESAGYTSLGIAAPPRYASWHEDEYGCSIEVGVAGAMREACPASPPAPIVP